MILGVGTIHYNGNISWTIISYKVFDHCHCPLKSQDYAERVRASEWLLWLAKELARTHTHPFNGPFSGTTQVSRYQKGKTNLDFTEARDSEWQWHQLRHMQVCTSLQTDNHARTPPLNFLQAGCRSCRPTNSVKALKANWHTAVRKFCRSHPYDFQRNWLKKVQLVKSVCVWCIYTVMCWLFSIKSSKLQIVIVLQVVDLIYSADTHRTACLECWTVIDESSRSRNDSRNATSISTW